MACLACFPWRGGPVGGVPARKKILLVEDDPTLSQAICGLLQTSGYKVSAVNNGAKALDQIDRRAYDLMLLDVGLPQVDGLEVLSRLRSRRDAPRVIVL